MSVSSKIPGLPRDVLRPKFWEVSADHRDTAYKTPFEKYRVLSKRSIEDMAESIIMSPGEYAAFERGEVRPVPLDILAYCEVLHLHPLDLYEEPFPGTPLPADMRGALQIAAVSPAYDENFRMRAHERLVLEHQRAQAILREKKQSIKPLLLALRPAFFDIEVDSITSWLHQDEDDGAKNKRSLIDAYLNAHLLVLEEEVAIHAQVYNALEERRRINKNMLHSVGHRVYGHAGVEAATMVLRRKMEKETDFGGLKEKILKNPEILGRVSFEATGGVPVSQMGQERRAEMQGHLRLFVAAMQHDMRHAEMLKNQEDTGMAVVKSMRQFIDWRAHPHTVCLLDWVENVLVLEDYLGESQAEKILSLPEMPKLKNGLHPL